MEKITLVFDLQWALRKIIAMAEGAEAVDNGEDDPKYLNEHGRFPGLEAGYQFAWSLARDQLTDKTDEPRRLILNPNPTNSFLQPQDQYRKDAFDAVNLAGAGMKVVYDSHGSHHAKPKDLGEWAYHPGLNALSAKRTFMRELGAVLLAHPTWADYLDD
ncbi:hypothetical protein GGS23DRAFT_618960 [Durotheca rogersii]|uniref:uncharacterized protein n=1 Tax=Durotheca rogersii TaxID=419775 RepID=UPI0022203DD4|nr:uncharacterized protein GGS23DRAFT_618960 [Durotheca rogersii]KAI5855136.1 hypothetical protein GGS23DRAFT_618960 [Durotheca rogersii]